MKNLILFMIIVVLGCSKANSLVSPVQEQENTKDIARPQCMALDGNPFKCVETKCIQAGGQFDTRSKSCLCGPGKVFSGWGAGSCVDIDTSSIITLKSKNTVPTGLGFTNVSSSRSKEQFNDLKNDAKEKLHHSDITLPTAPGGFMSIMLVGPGKLDRVYRADELRLLKAFSYPTVDLKPTSGIPYEGAEMPANIYYLKSPEQLWGAMRPESFEGNVKIPQFIKEADAINSCLSAPFIPDDISNYTDDGCAGHCILKQTTRYNDSYVTRRRIYVGGALYSDRVIVWQDSSRQLGNVEVAMFPSGEVSFIATFETRLDGVKLQRVARLYDGDGISILDEPLVAPLVDDIKRMEQALSLMTPATNQDLRPQVLVCESGFSAELIEKLGPSNFLLGPESLIAREPKSQKSLFGWNSGGALLSQSLYRVGRSFFSALWELTDTGMALDFQSYGNHAEKVSKILLGSLGNVRLLPIGNGACFNHADQWLPNVLKYSSARVLNFSATGLLTHHACVASKEGKSVLSTKNKVLWVVAAGNDGMNFTRESAPYCPQALSGVDNLLVVGDGSDHGLAGLSNRGKGFVDLAADGNFNGKGATSYATPRVAGLAAKIAKDFDALSIASVKKAILFGTKIPLSGGRFYPLAVRSGGVLDESRSVAAASLLSANPRPTDEEIIKQLNCPKNDLNCSDGNFYIQYYRNSGILK